MKYPMREIVINTGPVIALVAATGSLAWLSKLYENVWLPHEVREELSAGSPASPEMGAIQSAAEIIQILPPSKKLPQGLLNELDQGEASVIHTALQRGVKTVAIDEKAGRRVARLHGLLVTGSLGILVKAKKYGCIESLSHCINQMHKHGIWISSALVTEALKAAGES